ncbi:MAG: hypothetical protein K2I09_09950, partial [Duncaniella sp.]|nr:hypothetical protein [Duncaniella sp.]
GKLELKVIRLWGVAIGPADLAVCDCPWIILRILSFYRLSSYPLYTLYSPLYTPHNLITSQPLAAG